MATGQFEKSGWRLQMVCPWGVNKERRIASGHAECALRIGNDSLSLTLHSDPPQPM